MQQGKRLMFSVEEFRTRLEKTRERLRERGLAGMLVHTPENIYYLSGYHTPGYYAYQTMLVPADPGKPPVLVVRRLEESNVREFSWIDTRRVYTDVEDPIELTAAVVREGGLERAKLGVEKNAWFLTVANLEALARLLPGATLADGSGTVEQGRVIKSPAEIEYIRKGARAAEAAMRTALETTAAGKTEDEVAAETYRTAIWQAASTRACPSSSPPATARASRMRRGPAGGSSPATSSTTSSWAPCSATAPPCTAARRSGRRATRSSGCQMRRSPVSSG